MFFSVDQDGCAHFSNLPLELPGGCGCWHELEPGASLTLKIPSKAKAKPKAVIFRGRGDKKPFSEVDSATGAVESGSLGQLCRPRLSTSSDDGEEAPEEGQLELFSLDS